MANIVGKFLAALIEALLEDDGDDNRPRLSTHEDDGMTDAIYDDSYGNEYTRDSTGELKGWNNTPPD